LLTQVVLESGIILIGCTHFIKLNEKAIRAKRIFAMIHPKRIISFQYNGADIKLSGARNSDSSVGSSHFNLTKPHKGIRFNVHSVHFLSVKSFTTLGGIQRPNSCTLTPNFLAV
jgi:hypothetical protein